MNAISDEVQASFERLRNRARQYGLCLVGFVVVIVLLLVIGGVLGGVSWLSSPAESLSSIDIPASIQSAFQGGGVDDGSPASPASSILDINAFMPILLIGALIMLVLSGLGWVMGLFQGSDFSIAGFLAPLMFSGAAFLLVTVLGESPERESGAQPLSESARFEQALEDSDREAIRSQLRHKGLFSTAQGQYVYAQVVLMGGAETGDTALAAAAKAIQASDEASSFKPSVLRLIERGAYGEARSPQATHYQERRIDNERAYASMASNAYSVVGLLGGVALLLLAIRLTLTRRIRRVTHLLTRLQDSNDADATAATS